MKAFIVLALGVFLLAGAAVGGWVLYFKFMAAKEEAANEPPPPPPKPPTAFVRVPSIVVPVIGENKVQQFVTIVVTVEVTAELQPMAQAHQPLLNDAFLTTLYGAVDDRSIFRGKLIDIAALKEKLHTAAAKILGKDTVHDVLVQIVMQRNL